MAFVKIPKTPNKKARSSPHVFIDKEHVDLIFEKFPKGTTAHIPLMMGYKCGMRIGEAFAVTWDDVDFEKATITISKQLIWDEEKSKWIVTPPKYNSIRTVDIDDELKKLLLETQAKVKSNQVYYGDPYTSIYVDDNGYINEKSGTPISFVNVRENGGFIQPRIMQHASIVIHRTYPEFDFHSLRHTHCTMLIEKGAPLKYVQERLGHKNIKVTMDIYNHITESQKQIGKQMIDNIFCE